MFYSETLLSKTGALARVWLSANLERKLSKRDIRETNIESSVNAIVGEDQAPLALRLSGQLLLGVARIYRRKTGYLLDDCNEAVNKIRMTFRAANNDRPAHEAHTLNASSLTLQDVLTEIDLDAPFANFGDPSLFLLSQTLDESLLAPPENSLLNVSSQRLDRSIDGSRAGSIDPELRSGIGSLHTTPASRRVRDIDVGRDAPLTRARPADDDTTLKIGVGDDFVLDIGLDDDDAALAPPADAANISGLDDDLGLPGDITMGDDAGFGMSVLGGAQAGAPGRSESPLSAPRSSVAPGEPDQTMQLDEAQAALEADEDVSVHHAQRAKRRRVIPIDTDTIIPAGQIQKMQKHHDGILRPLSLVSGDPVLRALMEMQRNGGFVSNILGDGRSKGWAPELRGVLSLELIRQPLKRKRDARAPLAAREDSHEQRRARADSADSGPHSTGAPARGGDEARSPNGEDGQLQDEHEMRADQDDGFGMDAGDNHFDETSMPILHPAESGPVSQGTKHAVHLLRERFGAEAADSPNKRQQSKVLFQDLCPERSTTRADATKLFFECLVLATKDAVKVDQSPNQLGGPLHVRARRGLWGDWAEMQAGGEIAAQEEVRA